MRRRYRTTDIICGKNYITTRIYPEYSLPKGGRRKKSKPTSDVRQRLNDENRKEKVIFLANTNFTEKDQFLTLTYDEEHLPENYNQAEKELRKYIERLRNYAKKNNLPSPKIIGITGYGSKRKRLHHHLLINGDYPLYILTEKWKEKSGNYRGYIDVKPLIFNQFGIENIARYIIKHIEENIRSGIKCTYFRSRNLKEPKIKSRAKQISHRDILFAKEYTDFSVFEKMHPDYAIADVSPYYNDVNGGYYFTVKYYRPHMKRRKV